MAGERPDQWGRFFSTLDNKQVELCVRVNLLKHNKAWFYFELDQLLFYFFVFCLCMSVKEAVIIRSRAVFLWARFLLADPPAPSDKLLRRVHSFLSGINLGMTPAL